MTETNDTSIRANLAANKGIKSSRKSKEHSGRKTHLGNSKFTDPGNSWKCDRRGHTTSH